MTTLDHYSDKWVYTPAGKPYEIRTARTIGELDAVHRITHDSIVHAGYASPQPGGRMITYPELDTSPQTTILIATLDGQVIATNSLAGDGPLGLPTNRYFPAETRALRDRAGVLISSFRIATDPVRQEQVSKALVLDLIVWSYFIAIQKYAFDTTLCTVNPKHEGLYKRLLGATTVARVDAIEHGNISAGAVLMRIDRDRLPERVFSQLEGLSDAYASSMPTARTGKSRMLPHSTDRVSHAYARPVGAERATHSARYRDVDSLNQ